MILQSLVRLVIYIDQLVVREDGFTPSAVVDRGAVTKGIDNTVSCNADKRTCVGILPQLMYYYAIRSLALPVPDLLHTDRVRQDCHVSVDVHRGPHPAPHDLGGLLQGAGQPEKVLPQRMA